jgi:hypothetical protein
MIHLKFGSADFKVASNRPVTRTKIKNSGNGVV